MLTLRHALFFNIEMYLSIYGSACEPLLRAILLELWHFDAGIPAPLIMSHVDTRLSDLNAAPSSKYATATNDDYIIIITISEWP